MFWSLLGRGTGIRFDERLRGWFAFGEYDCELGAKRGRRERTRLCLAASIEIDHLNHFIFAPRHSAKIDGRLTFDATAAVARGRGPLVLFEPAADPQYVLMTYHVVFNYNEAAHFLAGTKLIPRERPLCMWVATTTLDIQLHRGDDARGPVIGAGRLHLSFVDFLRLLASMEAIEVGRARSARVPCFSFLVFFAKQLMRVSFGSPVRSRARNHSHVKSEKRGNAAATAATKPQLRDDPGYLDGNRRSIEP